MVVAIIAGRGGVGKTSLLYYLAKIIDNFRWAVMEKKDEQAISEGDNLYKKDAKYMADPVAILNAFQEWRDTVLKEENDVIVIDGVTDLRTYAIDEWITKDNKKRGEDGREPRTKIGKNNISAWEEINTRVKLLIQPIMNFAFFNNIHLFMTAQMKPLYINDIRTGDEIAIKEWLEYDVECLLILHKDKNTEHYWCSCEKAPLWSDGCFKEDLRKETGLLEVLGMHGLLDQKEEEE